MSRRRCDGNNGGLGPWRLDASCRPCGCRAMAAAPSWPGYAPRRPPVWLPCRHGLGALPAGCPCGRRPAADPLPLLRRPTRKGLVRALLLPPQARALGATRRASLTIPKTISRPADSKSSHLAAHPSQRCHPRSHLYAKLVRRPNKLMPVPRCLRRRSAASASSSASPCGGLGPLARVALCCPSRLAWATLLCQVQRRMSFGAVLSALTRLKEGSLSRCTLMLPYSVVSQNNCLKIQRQRYPPRAD